MNVNLTAKVSENTLKYIEYQNRNLNLKNKSLKTKF